jgi:nucleoside-diphosphate-sugar epimerase
VRIFITGISAYAGFHAARRLAAVGHTVTGLVRNPDQPRLELLRAHEVSLIRGDVADTDGYRAELECSDVVIHTMLDKKAPQATDRALFGALAALPKRSGLPRRFIYTTGCSIFGKVPGPIDEHTEPNPAHPLAFRRDLEKEALALPFPVAVLRPGFMYGNDGYNSVSSDWFAVAESGEEPTFRGDRTKRWSWIHIDDLAEAYRLLVDDANADGVFCAGDEEQPLSVDVMRACLDAAGNHAEIAFGPPLKGENLSTWFDQNELLNAERTRTRLGWKPRHTAVLAGIPAAYASWKAAKRLGYVATATR